MVKPGMPYLDIIAEAARVAPDHPLAVYQVSGEYAMIVAGARAGVYDLKTMAFESTQSFLRAGRCLNVQFAFTWLNSLHRVYVGSVLLHPGVPRLVERMIGRVEMQKRIKLVQKKSKGTASLYD